MIRKLSRRIAAYAYRSGLSWAGAGICTYRSYDDGYVAHNQTLLSIGYCLTEWGLNLGWSRTYSSQPGVRPMFLSHVLVKLRVACFELSFAVLARS